MTDDIGDGFAESQRERDFFLRTEGNRVGGETLGEKPDTCSIQCEARSFDLGCKPSGPVSADGFSNLG